MKIIELSFQKIVSKPQEIMAMFDEATRLGFEGVMCKKINAPYKAGARDFTWVKLKHMGEGKLADTIDAVVMGLYRGKGKRQEFGIGAFLVGIRQGADNRQLKTENQFVTVAKIGTGLSDDQWRELRKKCEKYAVKTMPDSYDVPKGLMPDLWVPPRIVVEIAADEITKSPLHTAGLALRFPRLVNFRDDKSPEDATTLGEVKKLASF